MKTAQNTPQFSATAAPGLVFSEACLYLARINPGAFANRPKLEALAAIRAAIAERPGNATPTECQAAARRAATGRNLADKVEAAPYYYPDLFADALGAFGIDSRAAVVELLRAYHRSAWHLHRCEELKAASAARRAARHAACPPKPRRESVEAASRRYARLAAREAARPLRGATAEENARARRGFEILKARGAFN